MGYGIKIFVPRPLHYVTRSPGIFTNNLSSERVDSKGLMGDEDCWLWAPGLIYYYFTLISRTREQHESLGYFAHCTHTEA